MKDTVPGYVIRDVDGNLIGLKCPLSGKSFWGETCERDQYHHTQKIMEAQGIDERMSIADRRHLYERGQGR